MESFEGLQNEVAQSFDQVDQLNELRKKYLNDYQQNMIQYQSLMQSISGENGQELMNQASYYYDAAQTSGELYEGVVSQLRSYIGEFEAYKDRFNIYARDFMETCSNLPNSSRYGNSEIEKTREKLIRYYNVCNHFAGVCDSIIDFLNDITGGDNTNSYGDKHL